MCCKHICFIVWQPLGPCPLVRRARSPELGQRARASGCVSGGTDNSSPAPPRLTKMEKKTPSVEEKRSLKEEERRN